MIHKFLFLTNILVFSICLTNHVMEGVILLESPSGGFVLKGRPVTLSCRAANANKIRFKCHDQWISENRYETKLGTDPQTQLPYMETSVDITRPEVEARPHQGSLECVCYASGSDETITVRSDPAQIYTAYMRKHFVHSPVSQRVAEGATVQLPCVAPDSHPTAQLSWYKDGVVLERSTDSNIIHGSDGSLILSSVRLSDSGNYSCEASNVAATRNTEPATLSVYVTGGWSSWSLWSGSCQTDCLVLRALLDETRILDVLPRLRRTRTCNNPAPLNGGPYCIGPEEDMKDCDHSCRLDGRWSEWSEWSACTPTCHKFRSRTCTVPSPMNGGAPCEGRDLDTAQCSQDYCVPSMHPLGSETALYGGLAGVGILLLIILGLCAALLCRRAKGKKTSTNIYYSQPGGSVRRVLLEQQQRALLHDDCKNGAMGSQLFHGTSVCSPSPLHPSMTLRSAKSAYSAYSANRYVGSRAALITECSSASSSGGGIVVSRPRDSPSEDENYATLYDYLEERSVQGLESSQAVLAAQVDFAGARLQLRKSGAALLVPEGALMKEKMLYLAVSDQISDKPTIQPDETVLSSVVVVGECEPASDRCGLSRPVVVSFQHCASLFPKDNWIFTLYADQGYGWHPALTVGEENLNTTMYLHMEPPKKSGGWCHVMTESLGRLVLVGRPKKAGALTAKRVHMAVYGSDKSDKKENPLELRVYCVPETGAAMQSVAKQEENSRLLAESEHFVLQEHGNLCFCVEEVAENFHLRGSNLVVINETQHQWCSQNGIHVNMVFDGTAATDNFHSRLVVFQENNNSEKHAITVQFQSFYDSTPVEDDKLVSVDFGLPMEIKEGLAALLDPPHDKQLDWRMLASKLKLDRYVLYFGTRPGCSPSQLVLDLWEASEWGSMRAAHDLLQTLRVMGRADAAQLLESFLGHFSYVMSP